VQKGRQPDRYLPAHLPMSRVSATASKAAWVMAMRIMEADLERRAH
jgi:hypothetical protein